MSISVTEPFSRAIEETRRGLFEPFNMSKWFIVGLGAWLASFLGEAGGGGVNFPNFSGLNSPSRPAAKKAVVPPPVVIPQLPNDGRQLPDPGQVPVDMGPGAAAPGLPQEEVPAEPPDPVEEGVKKAVEWVEGNVGIAAFLALAFVLVIYAIGLIFTWLGCRAQFVFIDNIAKNRGEFGEPWREYRREGNSLFWFYVVFGLLGMVIIFGSIAGGVVTAWPDVKARTFGGPAITGIAIALVPMIIWGIAASIILFLVNDFVVPVMFIKRLSVKEAWPVVSQSVVSGHVGKLVLYFLFKLVLNIPIGIIRTLATCLTCCIASLPYIGTVVTLPLPYFYRCYNLAFLEQFGPEFRILGMAAKPPWADQVDPELLS